MRIKITREGSLLSVVLDREITETQASIIQLLLSQDDLSWDAALGAMATIRADYDAPVGAGDAVEAYRG